MFLDETGTLGGERDPFFAVGLLQCEEPYDLLRPIQRIRDTEHYYDEMKWNKVSNKNLPILQDVLSIVLKRPCRFHVFIADKQQHDIIGRFGGQFNAYEWMARQLVIGTVRPSEVAWVIADEYSTPPKVTFEENVRDYVNRKLKRTAVAGVCRMRSEGVDLLQVLDLLLGAIAYEFKESSGVVSASAYKPKTKLLQHIKREAGVSSFVGGYRDDRLQVEVYHG
jgi:hypothetical protein